MKNKLCIQKFIEEHADWEKLLSEKPYCISISRDVMFGRKLIMFKYSQIDSDFNIELVRECRGIILDEDTLEVICHPFNKFGNYEEPYTAHYFMQNNNISKLGYQPFTVTTGSGRSHGDYTIVLKPYKNPKN